MDTIGKVFGWLRRKAVLYVVLLAAILGYAVWTSGDVQSSWKKSQALNHYQADQLQALLEETKGRRQELSGELATVEQSAQIATVSELEKQIAEAQNELGRLQMSQPSSLNRALAKATIDIKAIRDEQERLIRVAFLEKKLAGLARALDAARNYDAELAAFTDSARRAEKVIKDNRNRTASIVSDKHRAWDAAQTSCRQAMAAIASFDRSWISPTWDRLPLQHRRADLVETRNIECAKERRANEALARAKSAAKTWRQMRAGAERQPERVKDWIDNDLPFTAAAVKDRISEERESARKTISARATWAWTHYHVSSVLKRALAALAFIIVSPFFIRLFCWFVLAPVAMRRQSIRLHVPEGRGVAIVPAAPSATSVAVRLSSGEELLVRQDYLQTSSHVGAKGTQWFLDWKKPITSSATGLTFLTRIRGDGETTTISATRDGLAEVTVLTLPEGASCVLQPRALAAVAQPIRHPLRITRHWRLNSLNAWLTLQLRYLVFHGPVRLVLKGGRGVRVEAAEQGRVFGQDQLVGFSADLAYSVTRAETFWPYFLGRAQLLKDRVMAGAGVLIVEEAPLTVRRGEVRRGLEGMIDAGMKVFGM